MQASFTKKKPTLSNKLGEYQEHGVPNLVTILEQKGNEYVVLNSQNQELTIQSNRIFQLPGKVPPQFTHRNQIISYLRELAKESNKIKENVNLARAWENFHNFQREITLEQIQKAIFPNQNLANFIAVRWALLSDRHYFKRGKVGFTPRPGESVEAIKEAIVAEEKRLTKIKQWSESISAKNPNQEMICNLEKVAALGRKFENFQEIEDLFNILQQADYKLTGKYPEDQAFGLLIDLGIFSKHENLIPLKLGRATNFSENEIEAAKDISNNAEDFTELLGLETFTIDGEETRDFDDALSIENNDLGYRVGIHITDVSSYIRPGELLWETSLKRGATVYTADQNYPMLPHIVSEERLSLIKDQARNAISIFINFDKEFNRLNSEIQKTKIIVKERISYEKLDQDFENNNSNQNLLLLLKISQKLEAIRIGAGAKVLPKREMLPIIDEHGNVTLAVLNEETPARKLVGEMMILANHCMATFAKTNNIPFIYRHQEAPETKLDESTLPQGPAREYVLRGEMKRSILSCFPAAHHGLALDCYCQCTSPIRRFVDLINQYQINQFLSSKNLIDRPELEKLLPDLETCLGEVTYIQRKRHRYWLLVYIEQNKIVNLEGTIVKTDGPRPLVELDGLFLISQFSAIKNKNPVVGEKVKIKVEQISARLDRFKLSDA